MSKFPSDNKFQLGEIVGYNKDSKLYYVVGIKLYLGYDFHSWLYSLSKPLYGECSDCVPWASRCDVSNLDNIKEDDICSMESMLNRRKSVIDTEIKRLEADLDRLRKMKS